MFIIQQPTNLSVFIIGPIKLHLLFVGNNRKKELSGFILWHEFYQRRIIIIIKLTIPIPMAEQLEPHILKKYEILQKLGKGAYGVVWKAIDKQNRQTIALKKVFDAFQNATDAQRTYREVMFLKELRGHPNIVNLDSLIRAGNNKDIYLVFDFMETDLHAVIRGNILEDVHRRYIMFQILKGLKYMHTGELIHRDLKPSNILLDSDCLAKLADFGLARSVALVNQDSGEAIMTEYVATRWYRAPQILMGSSTYTKSVDMWSVGCILGQMYSGKPVFPGNSTINQIERIVELLGKPTSSDVQSLNSVMAKQCLNQINLTKKKSMASTFGSMDKDGLDLLRKLLTFNPHHRYTVEEALDHPYLKDFHDLSEQICFKGVIRIPVDENTKYSIKQYRQMLYQQMCPKGGSSQQRKSRESQGRIPENEKPRASYSKGGSNSQSYCQSNAYHYRQPSSQNNKLQDITNEYVLQNSQNSSKGFTNSSYQKNPSYGNHKAKTQASQYDESSFSHKQSQPNSKTYEKIDELRKWYSRQQADKKKESSKENQYGHSKSKEKQTWMRVSCKDNKYNYENRPSYDKPTGYIWKK